MIIRLSLFFFWALYGCENNSSPLVLTTNDCSVAINGDEGNLCYYYYKHKSIWDTLLVTDSNAIEVYRLQFELSRTEPTFYLHSQIFLYPDGQAKSIIKKYAIAEDHVQMTSEVIKIFKASELALLVQHSDFWSAESSCLHCSNTFDGDVYLLEGWKKDQHQIIYRTSFELASKVVDAKEKEQLAILDSLFNKMMGGWPFVIVPNDTAK